MKRRRTYHHGDLPAALLEAADTLIAQNGVAAFSLREAARKVGVDPAACYRHFRDREAVLRALARRGFTRLAARVRSDVEALRSPSPEKIVRALAHAYVEFAIENPSTFRVMFGPTGVDARNNPVLRGEYPEEDSPYLRLKAGVRAWAEENGKKVNVEEAAVTLWAGVHGLACLLIDGAFRPANEKARTTAIDALVRTMLAGLAR